VRRRCCGTERRGNRCITLVRLNFLSFSFDSSGKIDFPFSRPVAWPDARNASTVRQLRAKAETRTFHTPDGDVVGEEGVRRLTGLPFSSVFLTPLTILLALTVLPSRSTYFSATKWSWLYENIPEVKEAAEKDNLMMGTVDSWLVYVRSSYFSPPLTRLTLFSTHFRSPSFPPFSATHRCRERRSPHHRRHQRLPHSPLRPPRSKLVRRAVQLLRNADERPPQGRFELGGLRKLQEGSLAGGNSDCWVDWRSAGGARGEQVFD
jgi:hypothetical protein